MGSYTPPFNITNRMLRLVSSISEKVGKISVTSNMQSKPHLRKNNRIKSIHSSLKIEANSLTIGQVRDVINGKYGNGEARKKALGELYEIVQKRVNEILKGSTVESITYRVVKGDNLTKIAKKYGVTVNYLKNLNNIKNANLIYVGQIIKIK